MSNGNHNRTGMTSLNKTNLADDCIHRFIVELQGGGVQCAACNEVWHSAMDYSIEKGKPANEHCEHATLTYKRHGIVQCVHCAAQFKDIGEAMSEQVKRRSAAKVKHREDLVNFLLCKHSDLTYDKEADLVYCVACNTFFDSIDEAREVVKIVEDFAELPKRLKIIKESKAKQSAINMAIRLAAYL